MPFYFPGTGCTGESCLEITDDYLPIRDRVTLSSQMIAPDEALNSTSGVKLSDIWIVVIRQNKPPLNCTQNGS